MEITELLDQLAEFQSEADYLALKKQELIDAVKIPAEVLAAQDEANKARQAVDSVLFNRQKDINTACREAIAAVVDPIMPAEFVAALAEAKAKRQQIQDEYDAQANVSRDVALEKKAKIDADLQARVADVYKQVAIRKAEINAEFDDKAAGVLDNIAALTARIKGEVKTFGATVKGKFFQAVYVKGRVTWNTDKLESVYFSLHTILKMIESFVMIQDELSDVRSEIKKATDTIANARKESEPSVTLRKVGN